MVWGDRCMIIEAPVLESSFCSPSVEKRKSIFHSCLAVDSCHLVRIVSLWQRELVILGQFCLKLLPLINQKVQTIKRMPYLSFDAPKVFIFMPVVFLSFNCSVVSLCVAVRTIRALYI